MAIPITKKQKQILDFLETYYDKYGFMPTYLEMSNIFKLSKATIWEHLYNLEKAGRIKMYHKARGIEIT